MELQKYVFDPHTEAHQGHQLAQIAEFAASCPLEPPYALEIGSNRGRFLAGLAELDRTRSTIGIELKRKLTRVAQGRLDRRGLDNGRALHADVTLALPLLFAEGSIERVFMLFPDPWWKKRHTKRRLLSPEFLQLLAPRVPEGGYFIVKTDVEPYFEFARDEVFAGCAQFRLLEEGDPSWPADEDRWPMTTRERHIVEEGLPIYKLYALRTGAAAEPERAAPVEPLRFDKPSAE